MTPQLTWVNKASHKLWAQAQGLQKCPLGPEYNHTNIYTTHPKRYKLNPLFSYPPTQIHRKNIALFIPVKTYITIITFGSLRYAPCIYNTSCRKPALTDGNAQFIRGP